MTSKSPSTRPSLLIRIRDAQNCDAWEEFVEIYAPLIFAYARRQGRQDADAADVTQDVLGKVHRAIGRLDYDRQRGRFRSWLLTITRNTLRKRWAFADREPQGSGDTGMHKFLEQRPNTADSDDNFWQQEYHRCLFRRAATRIQGEFRSSTWQAFWETAVEGHQPAQVAESVGMTVGAVYTAKSRVLTRLRDEIERMQGEGLAEF